METTRLAVARDLIDRNQLSEVPSLLEETLRNSEAHPELEAHGEMGTRNLALFNLIYALRRLNRLSDAGRWCQQAHDGHEGDSRFAYFCTAPLTAFTQRDPLFPPTSGVLSADALANTLASISQLVMGLREDPNSFSLKIDLGRAYARLATHYFETGQEALARPRLEQAVAIRNDLVKRDPQSPVIANFSRRVEALQK